MYVDDMLAEWIPGGVGTFAKGHGRDLIADAVREGREVLAKLVTSAAQLVAADAESSVAFGS